MATYDRRTVPYIEVHPFPIAKDVALAGKASDSDTDISLKRGTVLAKVVDGGGIVRYKQVENWSIDFSGDAYDEISHLGGVGPFIGNLQNGFLDPTRTILGRDDGRGEFISDVHDICFVDFMTGRYRVSLASNDDSDTVGISYFASNQNGSGWPVAVLLEDVDIDSTDDFENVPVLVTGGISQDDLIFPSDADDDDIRGFLVTMLLNGIAVR